MFPSCVFHLVQPTFTPCFTIRFVVGSPSRRYKIINTQPTVSTDPIKHFPIGSQCGKLWLTPPMPPPVNCQFYALDALGEGQWIPCQTLSPNSLCVSLSASCHKAQSRGQTERAAHTQLYQSSSRKVAYQIALGCPPRSERYTHGSRQSGLPTTHHCAPSLTAESWP